MNNQNQYLNLIEASLKELGCLLDIDEKRIISSEPLFRNVPPVLWFGNIGDPNKKKVLVISANPSHPDKPTGEPRIPSSKDWNLKETKAQNLMDDYNGYFSHKNRDTNWFGNHFKKQVVVHRQGRIEDFLNGLDASFYGGRTYLAIHIDLLPFSTTKPFSKIALDIFRIDGIPSWIDKHVKALITLIRPEFVIINGVSNFNFFNQNVNLGAQPYQSFKYGKSNIWIGAPQPNTPSIIAISENMGSSCRKNAVELQALGEFVKSHILSWKRHIDNEK